MTYAAIKEKVDKVIALIEEQNGGIVDVYQKAGESGTFAIGIQFIVRPDPISQNYHE